MIAPYFPVDFESIASRVRFVEVDEGVVHQVGSPRLIPFPMHHPQGAAGYRIETPQGVIVYASDLEPGDSKLDRVVREASEGARTLVYTRSLHLKNILLTRGGDIATGARLWRLRETPTSIS
jgi:Cft2 family RNA processing exonuclease